MPKHPNPRSTGSGQSFTITPAYSVTLPGNGGKRRGKPTLIVLHNTDGPNQSGTGDLKATESTLRQRGLSVHVVNDGEGKCARLCPDDIVAYHAQGWNTQSLGIEQVSKIGQPLSSYSAAQIDNTAMWIAYWSNKYDIPIKHSNSHGICGHSETKGNPSGTNCMTGAYPWKDVLEKAASFAGKVVEGDPASLDGSSAPGDDGGVDLETIEKISKATAFATYFNYPGLFETTESLALRGHKSLMNDQPLLPFVQQLSQACLRSFQSLPNGDFFAFYPDYFGGQNHRTPYWDIEDIEILTGEINLTDDNLATHVYTVGDIVGLYDGVTMFDRAQTSGVVSVFNAFMADFMNPEAYAASVKNSEDKNGQDGEDAKDENASEVPANSSLADKAKAISFLRKYGARPHYEEAPMVRSGYYETFLAYQKFMLMWSRQFNADFSFTFMPEVFPGGIIRFPQHDLQMYVEEVTHNFDYETGFETHVKFIAPADAKLGARQNTNAGMIRAGALSNVPAATKDDKSN